MFFKHSKVVRLYFLDFFAILEDLGEELLFECVLELVDADVVVRVLFLVLLHVDILGHHHHRCCPRPRLFSAVLVFVVVVVKIHLYLFRMQGFINGILVMVRHRIQQVGTHSMFIFREHIMFL